MNPLHIGTALFAVLLVASQITYQDVQAAELEKHAPLMQQDGAGSDSPSKLVVVVLPGIAKEDLKLHQEIVYQLSRRDFKVKERSTYYSWLDHEWRSGKIGSQIMGWSGVIENAEKTPKGWIAYVVVRPVIKSGGTVITRKNENYIEVYEMVNGDVKLSKAILPLITEATHVISFN